MTHTDKQIKNLKTATSKSGESGFSLMEVLLALVLFLVITGAVYGLLQVSRIDRDRSSNRSDMLKNTRMTLNLIMRDAVNAGVEYTDSGARVPDGFLNRHLGLAVDSDGTKDTLASVIAGNNINLNDLGTPGVRTDVIAFASVDGGFGNVLTVNGTPFSKKFKELNARSQQGSGARVFLSNGTNADTIVDRGSAVFDLYLIQTADNRNIAALATTASPAANFIDFAPGSNAVDPLGINMTWTGQNTPNSTLLQPCTLGPPVVDEYCSAFPATIKRFEWVSYYVTAEGVLVRKTYGNKPGRPANEQIEEAPIAYGVENLQFVYLLQDGTVTDDPSEGEDGAYGTFDDTPAKLNDIRQITATITIRSAEIDKQTGEPLKITMNSTFSTRNMEYIERP